ncbi:MAG: TatD family hydrolase [Candidatus Paceibacterota bacterium]
MPEYFDFHCHIAFSAYKKDREEVLSRMKEKNIWAITVGTDFKHSEEALSFAKAHDGVFATVGLHPADNKKESFDESKFDSLVVDSNVVMVGECGLDYYHEKEEAGRRRQLEEFEKQIEFAVRHDKPLMLHVRDPLRRASSEASAYDDALSLLSARKKIYGDKLRGNAHFFTASSDIAKRFYDIGFTTSFPGVITFAPETHDAVRYAPKDMILSETDAPYASPVPHRGERNEPSYVTDVVEKIAELRGGDIEKMKAQLVENAFRVLNLKRS